jgi:two-component system, OmpR family, sensor kinase
MAMHLWRQRLHQHLYWRIWLALVGALAVLTLLLGAFWQFQVQQEREHRAGRQIVIRNTEGEVLGEAPARAVRMPGQAPEFQVQMRNGEMLYIQLPRPPRAPGHWEPAWYQSFWAFVALLVVVASVVALATFPVARRLTQRLETLQRGVERWGDGDLSARLPVHGSDEVAFLAQRFNAAANRVQALLTAHKTLLANASHELRSPLARIRMGLELTGTGGPSPAQREEMARNIAELDQLIDEILLASRLDLTDPSQASMGPTEEVDLLGLAAEECARTGAQLDVTDPLPNGFVFQGHAKLLRRLLRNLLENARRYGLKDGDPTSVTVGLGAATVGGASGFLLVVCDRGPGIPAHVRERVFEPFFRLPGASEREGGVGLGLSLVKTIAERHGGWVRCEDASQGGAKFTVFLPN